ncbi:MAG: hypothetical protein ACLS89_00210 [Collinsella sp.]
MLKFHFTLADGDNDPIEFDAGRTSNWKSIDAMASIPDSRTRPPTTTSSGA